jgi:hypothetical protein
MAPLTLLVVGPLGKDQSGKLVGCIARYHGDRLRQAVYLPVTLGSSSALLGCLSVPSVPQVRPEVLGPV